MNQQSSIPQSYVVEPSSTIPQSYVVVADNSANQALNESQSLAYIEHQPYDSSLNQFETSSIEYWTPTNYEENSQQVNEWNLQPQVWLGNNNNTVFRSNSLANETVVAIELNETLQIAKYKNKDVGSEISTIDGIELFVYKLSINSTVTVRNKQTHTIIDSGANVHIASMEMAKHALKLGYRIYASEVKATIRTAEQAGGMHITGWLYLGGYIGIMAVSN